MLCASIGERSAAAAIALLRELPPDLPLVEIRLDRLDDPAPEPFCREAARRLILTCRRRGEGGGFEGSEIERLALLRRARRGGARFVDVEMDVEDSASVVGDGSGVLRSFHDFSGAPADLDELVHVLRRRRGEAWKLAVTPSSLCEALRILRATGRGPRRVAWVAMGRYGLVQRVLAEAAGSFISYGAANPLVETGPGQASLADLRVLYRCTSIGKRPRVYGLHGVGISHSLSPKIHNGWFAGRRAGRVYIPFDAPGIEDFLEFARRLPLAGWSVTTPFKEEMARRVDRLAPSASQAGAVNTVLRRRGRLIGYNTDTRATIRLLRRMTRGLRSASVLVLGAGGTAKALCRVLPAHGFVVLLSGRRANARRIADALPGVGFVPWRQRAEADVAILVNATRAGHGGEGGNPLPPAALRPGRIVVDFPYGEADTLLARAARRRGCRVIDGKRILLEQARLQSRLFLRT